MKHTKKKSEKKMAVCVLTNVKTNKIVGNVIFTQNTDHTQIKYDINEIPNGKHGFHIHAKGNMLEGCHSLCSHFNPFNKHHGNINGKDSHVGDLGNIIGVYNKSKGIKRSKYLLLSGKTNIIGRSVVVHEGEDDLGKGGDEESLKTGNSGTRILCGIIGHY